MTKKEKILKQIKSLMSELSTNKQMEISIVLMRDACREYDWDDCTVCPNYKNCCTEPKIYPERWEVSK